MPNGFAGAASRIAMIFIDVRLKEEDVWLIMGACSISRAVNPNVLLFLGQLYKSNLLQSKTLTDATIGRDLQRAVPGRRISRST